MELVLSFQRLNLAHNRFNDMCDALLLAISQWYWKLGKTTDHFWFSA
jgi:hypothetical protein